MVTRKILNKYIEDLSIDGSTDTNIKIVTVECWI
jgi:hypothetical protein